MIAERRKLARLLRLERVRAIAKASAASEAARAEANLANLQALAVRSRTLAAEYTGRTDALDGADLRRLTVFGAGLHGVCRNTRIDVDRAQSAADLRQSELAAAERRRAAVADRAVATSRHLDALGQPPMLGGRRQPRAD